ncbi:hypothetical protein [Wielerella bovis]|uniref:hypothetical protein n=1 Tax=Wielerella bovis TaxID=2917790 RepID=UPI002019402D|nr:hypothetical protein [Wielerella bovis]ULJ66209.1 hypothetical protein MIS31_07985 [Wielerella bovis]
MMNELVHKWKIVGGSGLIEISNFKFNLTRYPHQLSSFDAIKTQAFKSDLEAANAKMKQVLSYKKPKKSLIKLIELAKKVNDYYKD